MEAAATSHSYEDTSADEISVNHLADHCYLPANAIIKELIHAHRGKFSISFSISGTVIELLKKYRPDVLQSFKDLVQTGYVEILGETYYHSLSSLYSKEEFQRQVLKHAGAIKEAFGIKPAIFRNTELIHNNTIASDIATLGYKGILCEGVQKLLKGRSSNHLYSVPSNANITLLLRNASLSDDIAFRFDDINWDKYPLTPEKFAEWLHIHPKETEVINLMLDYETFGIYKNVDSGIFDFLKNLPRFVLASENFIFSTPSAALHNYSSANIYDAPVTVSWEEGNASSSAWFEHMRQNNTLKKIYSIGKMVLNSDSEKAIETWGRLQASEYFYYMSEESIKAAAYRYHNPFSTPEEAFRNYCNIVADFEIGLIEREIARRKKSFSRASFINSFL